MSQEEKIKVWDIAVRTFHWSLVVLFVVAYVSGDDDSLLHIYVGYGVLALIGFRIVWGFIGSKHARFADFVCGPNATTQYAKSLMSSNPVHYLGHNPLGGWMIVALLVCLTATCWSGLEAYAEKGHGPLAKNEAVPMAVAMADDDDSERQSERGSRTRRSPKEGVWEEIHEALSNITVFLVFLHVIGAFVASALHRENLIKAMVTGYKTR